MSSMYTPAVAYALLRDGSPNTKSFATKAEAMAAVRQVIDEWGVSAVTGFALAYSGPGGGLRIVAEDAALVGLALKRTATSQRGGRQAA